MGLKAALLYDIAQLKAGVRLLVLTKKKHTEDCCLEAANLGTKPSAESTAVVSKGLKQIGMMVFDVNFQEHEHNVRHLKHCGTAMLAALHCALHSALVPLCKH